MEKNTGLIIREWKDEDAGPITKIIHDTWFYENEDDKVNRMISECFLAECLGGKAFARTAVLGGKVVGAIMGNDEKHIHLNIRERMHLIGSALKLFFYKNGRETALVESDVLKIYKELRRESHHGSEYEGEVSFFIVDKDARGHGVGGKLWKALMEYFREAGIEKYFVYTDTDCNYEFYEHEGFERRGEIFRSYSDEDISFFIYDKGFGKDA